MSRFISVCGDVFFFQAEDGIRDVAVTGVQTCALPISTAPVEAIAKLLRNVGWSTKDVDLFEINEAFAVVTMAAMKEHGIPHERVNVHGGEIGRASCRERV